MKRALFTLVLVITTAGCASSFHPTIASQVNDADWRIVHAPSAPPAPNAPSASAAPAP